MLKRFVLYKAPVSTLCRNYAAAAVRSRKELVHSTLQRQRNKMEVTNLDPEEIEWKQQILRYKTQSRRLENRNQSICRMIAEKESVVKVATSKVSRVANFFFKANQKEPKVHHHALAKRTKQKSRIQRMKTLLDHLYTALVRSLSWLGITKKPMKAPMTEKEMRRYLLRQKLRKQSKHGIREPPTLKKQEVLHIYKVVKQEQQKHEKRGKVIERYQLLFSSVWYFGILGLLYYIYLTLIRESLLNRNKQIYKMFDDKLVGVSHKALIESVLQSAVINEKVSDGIMLLMQEPKIKKLMTDLFIKLLHNQGFAEDTSKLLRNVTIEYLRSSDCHEKLVKLIVGEVLRNDKVLQEIFKLSQEYAGGADQEMLEQKLDQILIGVLEIPAVSQYVCEKIAEEVGIAFDERKLHDLAIRTAIENLKK